jgi:hypothetical protein
MKLPICITVDVDNDGMTLEDERNQLSWHSLEIIPKLAEMIHANGFPITWFVRADAQLRDCYGSAGFLLAEHAVLWRSLMNAGDEIGWHPHVYARGPDGRYGPERNDGPIASELRITFAELKHRGHDFTSVRMGEAIGSNAIMQTLADLGLRVDSSALPGRQRHDESRCFDWSCSPNMPYWPSRADYRKPGNPKLPILEVPMTTASVQAPYDSKPCLRYLNLAYRPDILSSALERWFDSGASKVPAAVLTLILHPDELMPRSKDHPLYASTPNALRLNLQALVKLAGSAQVELVGLTVSDVAGIVSQVGAA